MPSKRAVVVELSVIGALASLFVALFRTRPPYVDAVLGLTAVALIGFATGRSRLIWQHHRAALRARRARLGKLTDPLVVLTTLGIVAFAIAGFVLGHAADGREGAWTRVANWHVLVAAALYFPWALLQQFVFQFYLLGRLLYVLPARLAVGVTALVFSAVHFPRAMVMAGTVVAGWVWALDYRRHGQLWPLALSHALLGTTLHYWVFGGDLLSSWLPRLAL